MVDSGPSMAEGLGSKSGSVPGWEHDRLGTELGHTKRPTGLCQEILGAGDSQGGFGAAVPSRKGQTRSDPTKRSLELIQEVLRPGTPTPYPHSPPGGHRLPKAAPRSHWYGLVPQWRGQGALQLVLKGREVGRRTSQV